MAPRKHQHEMGKMSIFTDRPDGPLARHLGDVALDFSEGNTMLESADISKSDHREVMKSWDLKKKDATIVGIGPVIMVPKSIDMGRLIGRMGDERIRVLIEKWYLNCELYLSPREAMPISMLSRYKREWDMNAEGIYYRHFLSRDWEQPEHRLWVPTIDDVDWNHPSERRRRQRARVFLNHNLHNEKWHKSEYAWEADAWSDVWGLMRNDPVLAVNKHDYYTKKHEHHPVSCLLTGRSERVFRTPDATFGLATFKPEDYQNAWADYQLDRDRLEALMLDDWCGIVSDPKLGRPDLVFPFAVYEAKGWSGDAREARHQACTAGAAYLDLLEDLALCPGTKETERPLYQKQSSAARQVFAFTSFGSYWHVLVGYRRRRYKREHAGVPGMSKHVYVFQRLWSGRVITERHAWEFLSIVDQIHSWGVTEYRDCVARLLQAWHNYSSLCYANDARSQMDLPGPVILPDGRNHWRLLGFGEPEWAEYLRPAKRQQMKSLRMAHFLDSFIACCGPHKAGFINELFTLRKSFKRGGEGLEELSSADRRDEGDEEVRNQENEEPSSGITACKPLVLRPKRNATHIFSGPAPRPVPTAKRERDDALEGLAKAKRPRFLG